MTIEGNVMLANSYTSSSAGCQQPAIHFIVVTPRSLDTDRLATPPTMLYQHLPVNRNNNTGNNRSWKKAPNEISENNKNLFCWCWWLSACFLQSYWCCTSPPCYLPSGCQQVSSSYQKPHETSGPQQELVSPSTTTIPRLFVPPRRQHLPSHQWFHRRRCRLPPSTSKQSCHPLT